MAKTVFSLFYGLASGYYLKLCLVFLWNTICSNAFQLVCWILWVFHSLTRMWVEYFWKFVIFFLHPLLWPLVMIFQVSTGIELSNCRRSEKRNPNQSIQPRRNWYYDKYKFCTYWYLSISTFQVIDQMNGIFASTYTVFPHWVPFLIRSQIQCNDLDKNDIVDSSKWFALCVLSYPYKVFMRWLYNLRYHDMLPLHNFFLLQNHWYKTSPGFTSAICARGRM